MTDTLNRPPLPAAAEGVMAAVALRMEGGWISPEFMHYEARKAAAALRAAADQVVPDDPKEAMHFTTEAIRLNKQSIRNKLLTIAANLENAS